MKDKEFLEQSEKHLIENQAEAVLKGCEEEFKVIRNNRHHNFLKRLSNLKISFSS